MNQGKIIVGIAILLGICAGLAGYWWNYRVGHRAMAFWGQENARLVRLAPKVEYLELDYNLQPMPNDVAKVVYSIRKTVDLSKARGLIHLRNAILSDDQYAWDQSNRQDETDLQALRFTDQEGKQAMIYFTVPPQVPLAFQDINQQNNNVTLGPLAKSLEQFLAREVPRAQSEPAQEPAPAKSE